MEGVDQRLFSSNEQLLNDLNTFNQKYSKYKSCSSNNIPISETCKPGDANCCTSVDVDATAINDLFTKLNADIDAMNIAINNLSNNGKITGQQYYQNYNQIINEKTKIEKLRNELDNKLMNIHKAKGSEFDDMRIQNDSTIYTSILLTILATSILFITFTKL
jgi:Rps23 Pro-64 3,4-dihydroxylase Tpa1-like proline 4-hydroxylase